MALTQLTKEIQNDFNLNHIYARNVVYFLSNIKNIKKFGLYLLVLGLVLVGGFSSKVYAAPTITVNTAKITGPNQITIVFNSTLNLTAAPVTAYGIPNNGVAALTLASGGGLRDIVSLDGFVAGTTKTAVYTFSGAASTSNDTGSLFAANNPTAITDGTDIFDATTSPILLTDGQSPTLAASDIVVDNSTPDPNKVILTFSEPLEAIQAATVGNYLVTNGAGITYTISSAVLSPSNVVTLTLAPVNPVDNKTFITNYDAINAGIEVTPSASITDVATSANSYAGGLVTAVSGGNLDGTAATVNATLVKNSVTTFTVSFSEKLDKTIAENLTNYTLGGTCAATSGNPPVVSAVLQANGVDVLLTVPTTVGCSGGQTVIVTPSASITDVAGVAITSSAATKILAAAAITFTTGTDTRDYDGGVTSTGIPTVTSGSLAPGDSLFSSIQTFSDKNFGVGNKTLNITSGSIVIKNGGVDVTANYVISLVAFTTGTINALNTTASFTVAASRAYTGDTTVSTITRNVTGKIGGDDVVLSGAATYASPNVADGIIVSIATPSLTGATATNYNLTSVSTTTANITKVTPTATLAVSNSPQTYSGSGQAATVGITVSSTPGAVANILTGGVATQTNAGTHAVTANFVPTDTTNYNTLTALSAGNFVINKADTTASFTVAPSKTYDGGVTVSTLTQVIDDKIGLDDVSLTDGVATYADPNANTGITVSLAGATLIGGAAGNYNLTTVTDTTADITKIQLNHTTPNIIFSKIYDGDTTATITAAGTLSGVIGSGDVTATEVATYDNKDVGTGKTITVVYTLAGADQGNYLKPADDTTTVTGVISRRSSSGGGGYRPPAFLPSINIISTPVVVASIIPKLPKTGFPPQEKSTMFPIVALAGVSAISIFLYFAKKNKQIIFVSEHF